MSVCQRCGASIGATDIACRYCGAPHQAGIEFQRVEQARIESQFVARVTQEHYARTQAEVAIRRASRHALWWSLAALPICCLPVPGVVGIVLAYRARRLARQHRVEMPGHAVAAFAISALAFALCIAFYAFVILDSRALEHRRKELRATVEPAASAAVITQNTACALVELWLLENQFEGRQWSTSDHFDCPGKVERQDEHVQLLDIRLRRSQGPVFTVTGCLKRGTRWMVQDVRRGACESLGDPASTPKK
jgi:hypothetical protein